MNEKEITIESAEDFRLRKLVGHLKDAFLHSDIRLVPGDSTIEKIASYLIKTGCIDDTYEPMYTVLKAFVGRALDVEDPSGMKLRDMKFENRGHMKELQKHLFDGLDKSENHHNI